MSFYFAKDLLLFVTVHELLKPVQSVNGVIWNRKIGNFVPIFSVPAFAAVNQKLLRQSRSQETYNFQGEIVRLTYYEEMNIINGEANGTRVSGVIGEIWNTLAEYLNFTLKPIHSKERTLGLSQPNNTYSIGLLNLIQRNETDVVPRVEAHSNRIGATQFSVPLWQTSYRLYIRREVKHLPTWMLKLFSRRVWYAILITYFLLSVCSYLTQVINSKFMNKKSKSDLGDYFFYNFGMICGQAFLPCSMCKSSKMVELWLGIFSCLIRTAFGALLISYMTQTINTPPFHDLQSLLDSSSYNVFTLNGSLPNMVFQLTQIPAYKKINEMGRHIVAETMEEMYKATCEGNKPYAIYQSEDIKKARGLYVCRLNPVGVTMFNSWIVSGISWNFKYKRSIDIGILRLYEVGFIKLLKNRWIETKNAEDTANLSEPIDMEQVRLIIVIFTTGLCISFVIFLFENLTFHCNICHTNDVNKNG